MQKKILYTLITFTLIFCFSIGIHTVMYPTTILESIKSTLLPASSAVKNSNALKNVTTKVQAPYYGAYTKAHLKDLQNKTIQTVPKTTSTLQKTLTNLKSGLQNIKTNYQSIKDTLKSKITSAKTAFETAHPSVAKATSSVTNTITKKDAAYVAANLTCAAIGSKLPYASEAQALLMKRFLLLSGVTGTLSGATTLEKPSIKDFSEIPSNGATASSLAAYAVHYLPYIGLLTKKYFKTSPAAFKKYALVYIASQAFAPLATKHIITPCMNYMGAVPFDEELTLENYNLLYNPSAE